MFLIVDFDFLSRFDHKVTFRRVLWYLRGIEIVKDIIHFGVYTLDRLSYGDVIKLIILLLILVVGLLLISLIKVDVFSTIGLWWQKLQQLVYLLFIIIVIVDIVVIVVIVVIVDIVLIVLLFLNIYLWLLTITNKNVTRKELLGY